MPFKHTGCKSSLLFLTRTDRLWGFHDGCVGSAIRICEEKGLDEAIKAANFMHQQGISISRDDSYHLLQECTREKSLTAARQVHSLMISNGLDLITVLGDHLIRMFASCGSLLEASHAFHKISHPSVYTWNAIISSHVMLGECERALELYHQMQQEGILPVKVTFLFVLKACGSKRAIAIGRLIHGQLMRSGWESDMMLASAVIDMYGKCGNVEEGRKVFDGMPDRDVVIWGAMIAAYTEHGHALAVLKLFKKMQDEGTDPTNSIFSCIFKVCGTISAVGHGRLIHDCVISRGLDSEVVVGNSLIDMYAKFGAVDEAHRVFIGLSTRNVVSWGSLISGYVQHGQSNQALQLFMAMEEENKKPNEMIFPSILKACATMYAVRLGRLIYDQILKSGFESDVKIGSALIDMYAKCKSLEEARKVFDTTENLNEVSWGAMIGGYVLHGNGYSALELFEEMQAKGIKPNKSVFQSVLRACANARAIEQGRWIHNQIFRMELKSDVVTASTLVDMYAKCGSVDEAQQVFQGMPEHDVVSWSAIIGGYADHGHGLAALSLFQKMQKEGIKPDKVVYMCVLKACGCSGSIGQGRLIHHEVIKSEFELDVTVGSTLVDMYAKCGSLDEACIVFGNLQCQDVVAWGALIAGYVQHDHAVTGFEIFKKMQQEGIMPSQVICLCMVKACESMQSTEQGMIVHSQIVECGYDLDVVVGSSLVNLYAKSGNVQEASSVFRKLSNRDVVTWSTMIAGYVLHEKGSSALDLFEKMQQEGVRPDKVTCLLLLKACTIVGASGQGKLIHKQIIIAGFESDIDCGTAIVDMYAKCACLEDAYRLLATLPDHNVVAWGAMVSGHAKNGNGNLGKHCIEAMQQQGTKPDDVIFLSILTACSHAGLLEEGQNYLKSMRENYCMLPDTKLYNCLVDLLGRVGHLHEARDLLQCIPRAPNIIGWLSLLSGCRTYYNLDLGVQCYDEVVKRDQNDASGYVLMSNIYSGAHMRETANKVQELRKHRGAWKKPGRAWIEVNNKVHEFLVEGQQGLAEYDDKFFKFVRFSNSMKREGYVPELGLVSELMSGSERDHALCTDLQAEPEVLSL